MEVLLHLDLDTMAIFVKGVQGLGWALLDITVAITGFLHQWALLDITAAITEFLHPWDLNETTVANMVCHLLWNLVYQICMVQEIEHHETIPRQYTGVVKVAWTAS